MTILSRYILREFLKTLIYSLAVAVTLFMIIELFGQLDEFIEHRAGIVAIASYLGYLIPGTIILLCPVAVLLSSFITIGILSRNQEILALRANGVSLYRVVFPILACTFFISLASLMSNELIAPYTNRMAEQTFQHIKGKLYGRSIYSQSQLWYRGEGVIYNIKFFHPQTNVLEGVTLYFFDDDFRLVKRIDAERADWEKNKWVFANVTSRTFLSEREFARTFEKSCT
ncbi:MAG TPA: LptF/LptG family permease, partial [Thermodesulfobacteriota bacterium]|nr:LptF/LptG family permease [Thermodesulfobacteriota bacterium]